MAVKDTTGREIISSRMFDYPRRLVFRAWAEPQHLARWWGPAGFSNTFETFNFSPGGEWKFVMHGPNGANYPNLSRFDEIIQDKRIVFSHICPPFFLAKATFEDRDGKTLLTYSMLFETIAEHDKVKKIVVPSNEENFDRLEEELKRM